METNTMKKIGFIVGGVFFFSGLLLYFAVPSFEYAESWKEALQNRLQLMMAVAILIERSVEVYLNSTNNNGPDRHSVVAQPDEGKKELAQLLAAKVGLALGVLAAFAGVRLMTVFGVPEIASENSFLQFLILASWYGIDVVISGGLLAGGATIFHEVAELLKGGFGSLNRLVRPKQEIQPDSNFERYVTADQYYTINVVRNGDDSGRLTFNDGTTRIDTTCWWENGKEIDAGTYSNCSKTIMATKRYKSVYIKGASTPNSPVEDIFIHKGTSPAASDGCIVIEPSEMLRLYNAISPLNGRNVTVIVKDS